jgi:hypothetical protein
VAVDPVKNHSPAIFLSASIPAADRDPRYFETADVVAIRDCIKALVATAVPPFTLVWGGHPSITPLIRLLAESSPENVGDNFLLYQSREYGDIAPRDNKYFRHLKWVEKSESEAASQRLLRQRMIGEPTYICAVFVGGMDGIESEFNEFRQKHPLVPVFPIASTGGAASLLYNKWRHELRLNSDLRTEVAYPFLFRRLLLEVRLRPGFDP